MRRFGLLLAAAACAAPAADSIRPPGAGECVTGRVGNLGSGPIDIPAILRSPEGPLRLVGDAAKDVLALTGATVTVCGPLEQGALGMATFEIRSVDEMQAYLGVLMPTSSGFALDLGGGRPQVPLVGVPVALADKSGARVWVAGTWLGDGFAVKSFGVMPS